MTRRVLQFGWASTLNYIFLMIFALRLEVGFSIVNIITGWRKSRRG